MRIAIDYAYEVTLAEPRYEHRFYRDVIEFDVPELGDDEIRPSLTVNGGDDRYFRSTSDHLVATGIRPSEQHPLSLGVRVSWHLKGRIPEINVGKNIVKRRGHPPKDARDSKRDVVVKTIEDQMIGAVIWNDEILVVVPEPHFRLKGGILSLKDRSVDPWQFNLRPDEQGLAEDCGLKVAGDVTVLDPSCFDANHAPARLTYVLREAASLLASVAAFLPSDSMQDFVTLRAVKRWNENHDLDDAAQAALRLFSTVEDEGIIDEFHGYHAGYLRKLLSPVYADWLQSAVNAANDKEDEEIIDLLSVPSF